MLSEAEEVLTAIDGAAQSGIEIEWEAADRVVTSRRYWFTQSQACQDGREPDEFAMRYGLRIYFCGVLTSWQLLASNASHTFRGYFRQRTRMAVPSEAV